MLVRDPTGTPELQEISMLELLQRYPCRCSEARWLDAALENWKPMARPWPTSTI